MRFEALELRIDCLTGSVGDHTFKGKVANCLIGLALTSSVAHNLAVQQMHSDYGRPM